MVDDSILVTDRLNLRYQRESDIPFLIYLWTDEEMTKHTGGPRELKMLENEFRTVSIDPQKLEWDLWVIEDKTTRKLIGQAGFIPKEIDGTEYIELNYYISREQWRNGYALEIAKGLINYIVVKKKANEIISIIDSGNIISEKVARAVGMKHWKTVNRSGMDKLIYRIIL
jgi:RimJ/RimL family protein N-acetyltransferase